MSQLPGLAHYIRLLLLNHLGGQRGNNHVHARRASLRAAATYTHSVTPGVPEALLPACLCLPTPWQLMHEIHP